jgi:hypothetical protein
MVHPKWQKFVIHFIFLDYDPYEEETGTFYLSDTMDDPICDDFIRVANDGLINGEKFGEKSYVNWIQIKNDNVSICVRDSKEEDNFEANLNVSILHWKG